MEQTAQRERKIRVIPATKPVSAPGQSSGRRQRVAAYCRVSTDSEEQLTSYTAQQAYYTQKIGENPDWEMAGIFADKGITGTSAANGVAGEGGGVPRQREGCEGVVARLHTKIGLVDICAAQQIA